MANLNSHNSFKIHVIFSKLGRIVEKGIQNEEKLLKVGVFDLILASSALTRQKTPISYKSFSGTFSVRGGIMGKVHKTYAVHSKPMSFSRNLPNK